MKLTRRKLNLKNKYMITKQQNMSRFHSNDTFLIILIAMESAHINLHTKTLKLVDIEISRRTLLCFAWLVLCLIVNCNTRFSGLTNTWLKSDPQMLNMVGDSRHCCPHQT